MIENFDIAVLGNWHLSSVTAAVLASHGKKTLWVNHDKKNPWTEFPAIPVMEPGLEDKISKARAQNSLQHSNGFETWRAPIVWMAIDTPVNDRDEVDCSPLNQAIEELKKHKETLKLLILSSQVPIGTCLEFEKQLGVPVAYVPENLRLGKGIETFEFADRTVIGAQKESTLKLVKDLMSQFKTEFFTSDLPTSEMIKHATNIFLATSISFSNEFARIGEAHGVDSVRVGQALKLDKRIGAAAYVIPGLGFAGGTLPRDLRILQKVARENKIPSKLLDAVLDVNEATTDVVCEIARRQVAKQKGKVLILGYTYKADTDTLRRSLSVNVAKTLSQEGIEIIGFDPLMNKKDYSSIAPYLKHIENWDEIPNSNISCVMLLTARKTFAELNWKSKNWAPHTLILDAQNFLNANSITDLNWSYKRLWQPCQEKST